MKGCTADLAGDLPESRSFMMGMPRGWASSSILPEELAWTFCSAALLHHPKPSSGVGICTLQACHKLGQAHEGS